MALTDWMLRGPEIVTCNCDYGCPCQFNALPNGGFCTAVGAMHILEGHFGDIRLDGLHWASLASWPGPIHEGHGTMQRVIDERADPGQRLALQRILSGEESVPGATFFDVFAAMTDTFLPPLFLTFEFSADLESCLGHFRVPGLVEAHTKAITNPVTGKPDHSKLVLRHGFEFTEAEFASGTCSTSGPIDLNTADRHAHLAMLHITGTGPVR